jgi:hypothetical protein
MSVRTLSPRIVTPSISTPRMLAPVLLGPEAPAEQADPRSDNFDGTELDEKWQLYEGSGELTSIVGGGVLRLEIDAGASGGSFWYSNFEGVLLYQEVTGDFDVVATLEVFDAAGTGPAPTANFELAGIAAHDPDRAGGLNYVHCALGAADEADLRAEWKTTVESNSDSGNIETGLFGSISWPSGAGQLRLRRIGQVFTAFVRATSGDSWTEIQEIDRTSAPMPEVLQVGPMLYSNQASHDISVEYDSIVFT